MMHGNFDPVIVVLSVLTAALSVFVALDLTGRVAASEGASRWAWVVAGALATGVGLWTMHFTGMLALRLPVEVSYVTSGVGLALLIAVGASLVSLLAGAFMRWLSAIVVVAGIVLGLGMGAMHVVAMGAMRMAATPHFDNRLIAASMAIAIAAGIALVAVAARLRSDETWRGWRRRALAALVIGPMIAVMHYTAMAGTAFTSSTMTVAETTQPQLVATHGLAFTTIGGCVLLVLLALGGAAVDRALRHRAAVTTEHARLRTEAEGARDAAEAANRAKSEFLAAMSHELRTPLNAIAGYAELLEIGVHGTLNDKQQEDIRRIQRSQKHLLSLINDVLNFAKIEAGKVQFHPRVVHVTTLLDTVETMILPQIQARGLHFDCSNSDRDLAVFCDPEKAEQILLNLLSNAAKFTAPGGRVSVHVERAAPATRIVVHDTGVGIPPDKLDAIFEPFVQVERSHTSSAEGAGLGLAISRDLARAMNGDLTVESEVGVGSTFTLTLPMDSDASHDSDSVVPNRRQETTSARRHA